MENEKEEPSPVEKRWAEAFVNQGEDRRQHLLEAIDELQEGMEANSLQVRALIQGQPPLQLLGYLWAKMHMGFSAAWEEEGDDVRPKHKVLIKTFQFALEYVHAVWSSQADLVDEETSLDEEKVAGLFDALEQLERVTSMYCMASSAASRTDPEQDRLSESTKFHAKSTWVLIRGHRYQVLEEEFFKFILEPHSDVLLEIYGMDSDAIAAAIQAITDSTRTGFSEAVEAIRAGMEATQASENESTSDSQSADEKIAAVDDEFAGEMSAAVQDLFFGGICNLSRHTNFTEPLLEDLCYLPGQNTEFFADGPFSGTPMRTLPALIKPGIKLGDEYYVADGQFVRDSAYRTIQRGLLRRVPAYREEWNRRQKNLVERAYPTIFSNQLGQSNKYPEVYFRDVATGEWVETDLVLTLSDVLLVVEAKAGVMAMHSPATNFDRHERVIRELILKAYQQCKRFVEYLASAPEVPLYNLVDGEYVEVVRLRQRDFRLIFPIGLTVEAFTPFSAMCKEYVEIQPLLGKHPFMSMSVDDLFVLNRFLPTAGELLHYLEVRQQVAGIPNAMIFDEIEHLGAYITNNRFDISIREQLEEADLVSWDSFGDVVDEYFEEDRWKIEPAPSQYYPQELAAVLTALDTYRPAGWTETNAHIRNLGSSGRTNLAQVILDLKSTLQEHPIRRCLIGDEHPLQVWICRDNIEPSPEEMRFQGQISCLAADVQRVIALRLKYSNVGEIVGVARTSFERPTVVQTNYAELQREAGRQRARFRNLD